MVSRKGAKNRKDAKEDLRETLMLPFQIGLLIMPPL
jgi:hypothetical protein